MSNNKPEAKEITLDGEGQVTFSFNGPDFEVEIFQQSTMREKLTRYDARKLAKFLIDELI